MRRFLLPIGLFMTFVLALAVVGIQPAGAQTGTPPATEAATSPSSSTASPEMIKHGQYLVNIVGCVDCHTQIDPKTGQAIDSLKFAGGRDFPLDPAGAQVVYSRNITSDPETGLGNWTDEQIKIAITQGIDNEGKRLFPVMPYLYFSNMSDDDLNAIVAYVRTIPPIKNANKEDILVAGTQYPPVPPRKPGIVAPDPTDTAARGKYLMTALLTCGDCHTPVDPQTGAPDLTKYLAGGQPFEGPWGVVYGGNITPDQKTGIGSWTDDDIRKLIRTGVRPDGRGVIVMPWQVYTHLTDDDLTAVIHYLRTDLPAVENEIPAAALNPGFGPPAQGTETATQTATEAVTQAAAGAATEAATQTSAGGAAGGSTTLIIVAVIAILVVGVGLLFFTRKGGSGAS